MASLATSLPLLIDVYLSHEGKDKHNNQIHSLIRW